MKPIIIILLSIAIFSCNPIEESYIDPELMAHYNQFFAEASLRGVNVPNKDVILEVVELGISQNGYAKWGKKWAHIKINKRYLEYYKGKENYMVERLVFHEMGHGILGRGHNNDSRDSLVFVGAILGTDTLDNSWITIGIPLSIMHAGDKGSGGAGPYYQENRDYYLDELFNIL